MVKWLLVFHQSRGCVPYVSTEGFHRSGSVLRKSSVRQIYFYGTGVPAYKIIEHAQQLQALLGSNAEETKKSPTTFILRQRKIIAIVLGVLLSRRVCRSLPRISGSLGTGEVEGLCRAIGKLCSRLDRQRPRKREKATVNTSNHLRTPHLRPS